MIGRDADDAKRTACLSAQVFATRRFHEGMMETLGGGAVTMFSIAGTNWRLLAMGVIGPVFLATMTVLGVFFSVGCYHHWKACRRLDRIPLRQVKIAHGWTGDDLASLTPAVECAHEKPLSSK